MNIFHFFFFLSFGYMIASFPINGQKKAFSNGAGGQKSSAAKKGIADSVSKAADSFAKDANLVSKSLNALPSMTDKDEIKDTARKAFDAESDEDNHRAVLAAAAGTQGKQSNEKIMKYTPAVLDGLDAIAKSGTTISVEQNIPKIEIARNPNILPSITQLSNAALQANGVDKDAQFFPPTGQDNNNNTDNDDNQNKNNENDNDNDDKNNENNENNDDNDKKDGNENNDKKYDNDNNDKKDDNDNNDKEDEDEKN